LYPQQYAPPLLESAQVNELIKDDKSWFGFFLPHEQMKGIKKVFKHEGGIFDFDDVHII
jgi:hypothetical protein